MNKPKAIQVAGTLAVLASVGHGFTGDESLRDALSGYVGETDYIRAAYQFGSIGWLSVGFIALTCGHLVLGERRLALGLAAPLIAGAITNIWFEKGLHPGWVMLGIAATIIVRAGFASVEPEAMPSGTVLEP